ncbi:hypothetical protein IFR05_006018 [Cadophora sp. M221]|nr:hypothetical protein IFR05_006018 [Cadophora sp. M221]
MPSTFPASDTAADTAANIDLPLSSSPSLHLTYPTPAECQQIWTLIHPSWGDSLSLPDFLSESAYLLTVPLARDGNMTLWILVDRNLPPDQRPILASCETFKKSAVHVGAAAVTGAEGEVRDVTLHGIASVYCDPKYRGRGYAQRMMKELGEVLRTWQVSDGERCVGSLLYSDIGKVYYAKLGWEPVGRNTHLEFPTSKTDESQKLESESESVVLDADLDALCKRDEDLVRKRLAGSGKNALMVLPDADHMRWHHAKEDFVCGRIFERKCPLKGALVGELDRKDRVWAIWTRRFYGAGETARRENTLYILRLVFEKENPGKEDMAKMRRALKIVVRTAQAEAEFWGLGTVKLWDPSPLVLELIKGIEVEYRLVEREQECIASLMWYGDGGRDEEAPEWTANEKFAWL